MPRATRFPPEVRERTVRMVETQTPAHPSEWPAIKSIAEKIGCTPETQRSMRSDLALDALERALHDRDQDGAFATLEWVAWYDISA